MQRLGIEEEDVVEVIDDVRRRDAQRLELQMSGDLQSGRGLMKGNMAGPTPTPLTQPRRPGRAMNEEAAGVLGKAGTN